MFERLARLWHIGALARLLVARKNEKLARWHVNYAGVQARWHADHQYTGTHDTRFSKLIYYRRKILNRKSSAIFL